MAARGVNRKLPTPDAGNKTSAVQRELDQPELRRLPGTKTISAQRQLRRHHAVRHGLYRAAKPSRSFLGIRLAIPLPNAGSWSARVQ